MAEVFPFVFLVLSLKKLKEPTKAMAADTSQDKNFNERKQLLCTCVIHFCTFLCRPLQNKNVN